MNKKFHILFNKAKKYVYVVYLWINVCPLNFKQNFCLPFGLKKLCQYIIVNVYCKINVKSVPKFIFLYRKTCD